MSTRRYTAADRSAAIDQLGDRRAVDQAAHRLHVAEGGPAAGVALWVEPLPGRDSEALLGTVKVAVEDRRLFYQLVAACAQDALDRGFERARFTVRDRRLLLRIQRDFIIEPQAIGRDPETGEAVEWEVSVDLQDALEQLEGAIGA